MNNTIDQRLFELREKASRKKQLSAQIEALREQVRKMESKVIEQEWAVKHEEDDVTELLNNRWKCLWYRLIGYFDIAYTREENEMLDARLRYDLAKEELEETKAELERLRDEYIPYQRCDQEYEQLLQQKMEAVRASGTPEAEQLLQLEEKLQQADFQLKELEEAIQEGRRALSLLDEIIVRLSSADHYATWDVAGGGLIADALKYSELDSAQVFLKSLSKQLQRFRTELADINIAADTELFNDKVIFFADTMLDHIFVDLQVKERIIRSRLDIEHRREKLLQLLIRLDSMHLFQKTTRSELQCKIDALIAITPA